MMFAALHQCALITMLLQRSIVVDDQSLLNSCSKCEQESKEIVTAADSSNGRRIEERVQVTMRESGR